MRGRRPGRAARSAPAPGPGGGSWPARPGPAAPRGTTAGRAPPRAPARGRGAGARSRPPPPRGRPAPGTPAPTRRGGPPGPATGPGDGCRPSRPAGAPGAAPGRCRRGPASPSCSRPRGSRAGPRCLGGRWPAARLARRCPAGGDGDRRPEGVLEEVDGVARRRDADGGDGLDAGQLTAGDGGPGGQGSAAHGAPAGGLLQAPGEEQAGPGRDGHQGRPERPQEGPPAVALHARAPGAGLAPDARRRLQGVPAAGAEPAPGAVRRPGPGAEAGLAEGLGAMAAAPPGPAVGVLQAASAPVGEDLGHRCSTRWRPRLSGAGPRKRTTPAGALPPGWGRTPPARSGPGLPQARREGVGLVQGEPGAEQALAELVLPVGGLPREATSGASSAGTTSTESVSARTQSPGRTSTPPHCTAMSVSQGRRVAPLGSGCVPLAKTGSSTAVSPTTSRTTPSATTPAAPRTLARMASMSPSTAPSANPPASITTTWPGSSSSIRRRLTAPPGERETSSRPGRKRTVRAGPASTARGATMGRSPLHTTRVTPSSRRMTFAVDVGTVASLAPRSSPISCLSPHPTLSSRLRAPPPRRQRGPFLALSDRARGARGRGPAGPPEKQRDAASGRRCSAGP